MLTDTIEDQYKELSRNLRKISGFEEAKIMKNEDVKEKLIKKFDIQKLKESMKLSCFREIMKLFFTDFEENFCFPLNLNLKIDQDDKTIQLLSYYFESIEKNKNEIEFFKSKQAFIFLMRNSIELKGQNILTGSPNFIKNPRMKIRGGDRKLGYLIGEISKKNEDEDLDEKVNFVKKKLKLDFFRKKRESEIENNKKRQHIYSISWRLIEENHFTKELEFSIFCEKSKKILKRIFFSQIEFPFKSSTHFPLIDLKGLIQDKTGNYYFCLTFDKGDPKERVRDIEEKRDFLFFIPISKKAKILKFNLCLNRNRINYGYSDLFFEDEKPQNDFVVDKYQIFLEKNKIFVLRRSNILTCYQILGESALEDGYIELEILKKIQIFQFSTEKNILKKVRIRNKTFLFCTSVKGEGVILIDCENLKIFFFEVENLEKVYREKVGSFKLNYNNNDVGWIDRGENNGLIIWKISNILFCVELDKLMYLNK